MKKIIIVTMLLVGVLSGFGQQTPNNKKQGTSIGSSQTSVPFTDVAVKDAFWTPWVNCNRQEIIPHIFYMMGNTGYFADIDKASRGIADGKYEGKHFANEADVYKTIEAVAYSLTLRADPKLEARVDSLIDKIVAVQKPDGYLNVYFSITGIDKRWTNEYYHESYCAGHLIEGAIAWYQATGKRKLLDAAIRLADNMDATFGPGKKQMTPQHPEVELALVKLYHATNNPRYLKLAQYFIDERGHYEGRKPWYIDDNNPKPNDKYALDDMPVRQLAKAEGHTVRALYLYCGMADVATATGDKTLLSPLDKVWDDMVATKMFVTGGAGIVFEGESFGKPYNLPNDVMTAEGCTAVSLVLFAQRMSLLHNDARFMDVAERVLYNRLAAETSLNGQKFFYGLPMCSQSSESFGNIIKGWEFNLQGEVDTTKKVNYRSNWFDCNCCPTNIARFLPTIGGYVYGQNANTVFVNLYVGGTANLTQNGANLKLEQTGNYPWEGNVIIAVSPEKAAKFGLALRVPSWCEGMTFNVNGKPAQTKMDKGYARITRTWKAGDVVEINMPMPVKRVYADPRVEADRGRVALQRGPIVYCLEGVDNGGKVLDIMLPKDAKLTAEKRPDLLGGVTVITGTAKRVRNGQPAEDVKITAIPFYAWDNRPPSGEMVVWMAESAEAVSK